MFRIAICEDDAPSLQYEKKLIHAWAAGRAVCADAYADAEEFLFRTEDLPDYDLLILDIRMGAMNGMELAKKLRSAGKDASILFLTGLAEYAIEGYEVGAVRYLLKPIREDDFWCALDEVYETYEESENDYFLLNQGGEILKIAYGKILYAEAQGHYIRMKTQKGIREWKAPFSSLSPAFARGDFFLLKRGLYVNLAHVERITRTDCILDDGSCLAVARSRYRKLNEAFIAFYRGGLT